MRDPYSGLSGGSSPDPFRSRRFALAGVALFLLGIAAIVAWWILSSVL